MLDVIDDELLLEEVEVVVVVMAGLDVELHEDTVLLEVLVTLLVVVVVA